MLFGCLDVWIVIWCFVIYDFGLFDILWFCGYSSDGFWLAFLWLGASRCIDFCLVLISVGRLWGCLVWCFCGFCGLFRLLGFGFDLEGVWVSVSWKRCGLWILNVLLWLAVFSVLVCVLVLIFAQGGLGLLLLFWFGFLFCGGFVSLF